MVGMEPTGHYWKPLVNYLIMHGISVVMVIILITSSEPKNSTIIAKQRVAKKTP